MGTKTKKRGPSRGFSDMEAAEAYDAYYVRELTATKAAIELGITARQVAHRARVWRITIEKRNETTS